MIRSFISELSYNLPTFCPSASWNGNAITIANAGVIGPSPADVFVDISDTIYMIDGSNNTVQIWLNGNMTGSRTLSSTLNSPRSIFATLDGYIYSIHGFFSNKVNRWSVNGSNSVITMYDNGTCFSLFIDINNYIYCSMESPDQVVKKILNNSMATPIIVAGSASNQLRSPRGIFVDRNLNLYVADSLNNRIQMFPSGQLTGRTLPINGSTGSFNLTMPTDIALDAHDYLFISDCGNNRILGSDSQGFRCIVGCTNSGGSAPNQLSLPLSFNFDTNGNLLVVDTGNNRLQKFLLTWNECGKFSLEKFI